jgi:hypothetical protein
MSNDQAAENVWKSLENPWKIFGNPWKKLGKSLEAFFALPAISET